MSYNALEAWQQANSGNRTVQAASNDLFYNALAAEMGTKSAVNYAKRMMPLSLRYQRASQSIADESTLRQMAAEASIMRGLTQQQGDLDYRRQQLISSTSRYGADRELQGTLAQAAAQKYAANRGVDIARIETGAERYGYDQQLKGIGLQTAAQRYESTQATRRTQLQTDADRYGYRLGLEGTKYSADRSVDQTRLQTDADKYGYELGLEGTKYSADRSYDTARYTADRGYDIARYTSDSDLEGTKYVADRGLEGVRDTNRSEEERIRIRGGEDRKTLIQGTDETLRLRADARGAIRSAGRRFYG